MAATEDKSMSAIVEEFLSGDRRIVTDEAEMDEMVKGYELDEDAAEEIQLCEVSDLSATDKEVCAKKAVEQFLIPSDWNQIGKEAVWLCDEHWKQVAT